MTSLQYYCFLGLAEIKTLDTRDKIMRKGCRMRRLQNHWIYVSSWVENIGTFHSCCALVKILMFSTHSLKYIWYSPQTLYIKSYTNICILACNVLYDLNNILYNFVFKKSILLLLLLIFQRFASNISQCKLWNANAIVWFVRLYGR